MWAVALKDKMQHNLLHRPWTDAKIRPFPKTARFEDVKRQLLQMIHLTMIRLSVEAALAASLFVCFISQVEAFSPTSLGHRFQNRVVETKLSAISRRDIVEGSGRAMAAAMLGSISLPSFAADPKTFVITGGNSGIGFQAALQLARLGHTLVLPCRSYDKAVGTCEDIQSQVATGTVIPAECNLASLASVQSFAKELPSLLSGDKLLDTVCLNAGVARNTGAKDCARTAEGFELTVGTNHFGHFYLSQLLLPMIRPSGGRFVVTASGVHDPESPGGAQGETATLGDLQGLERDGRNFEMVDGGAFNADKAYKDSKVSLRHPK